jgi:hypothetical protein
MEIAEFIEQDVLIFLDDHIDIPRPERSAQAMSTLYLTRDYEKELTAALSRDEVTTAKQILHDLKDQFDACPSGIPDKEQLKLLLTTLYEKFKDYLDAKHIPAASAFQSAPEEHPTNAPANPLVTLDALIAQVRTHIEHEEFKLAIDTYRKAKREASGLSAIPIMQTKQLLGLYEELKNRIAAQKKDSSQEMDRQLLLQVEQEKHILDQQLRAGNIVGAIEQYKKMRLLAQQLQNNEHAQAAAQKLQRIYAILELMKKTHNDQHLSQALP